MKSTVCIVIDISSPNGGYQRQFGTAFFIDKKFLITAGHNVFPKEDSRIKIQIIQPGLSHVNYTKYENGEYVTIDCTVDDSLYKKVNGPYEKDIAILHAGSYSAPIDHFVELSADLPEQDAVVDVIGYPGELGAAWMRRQDKVNDIDESLKAVAKLLPVRTLTATRGTVQSVKGSTITYNVSTCPGMSGSCVLHKGKVIGIDPSIQNPNSKIGVHIGQNNVPGSSPSAVTFIGIDVVNLFRQRNISHLITKSS